MSAPAARAAARPLSPPRAQPRRGHRRASSLGGANAVRPPRRFSGPSGRGVSAAPASVSAGLISDPFGALQRIADHGLLDRLIRGRLWIGLIAFALIGIVAMQLVVLRLNTEIGRGLERKATLQREISALQVSNSTLSAYGRVETEAGRRGMRLDTRAEGSFLGSETSDAMRAAALLSSNPPGGSASKASASSTPSSGESGQGSTAASTGGAAAGGGPAGEQPAPQQAAAGQAATSGAGEGASNPPASAQLPASNAAEATAVGQGSGQPQAGEGAAAQQGASGEPAQQERPQGQQEGPQG